MGDNADVKARAAGEQNADRLSLQQRRTAELETLRRLSLKMTASLELEEVLHAILESVFALLDDLQNAHIFHYDQEELRFGAALWADGSREPFAMPRPAGVTALVARREEALLIADLARDALYEGCPENWQGRLAGLPLTIGTRVIGVMNVAGAEARPWTATERNLLELLADQAAVALENARLYRQLRQELAEREKAEATLKASEARFHAAVDHFPYTFVIYDAERRIQFINEQGLQITAYDEVEMVGRRDEELFPPSVTATYLPLLEEAVASRQPQSGEATLTLHGKQYTVLLNYVPLLDEAGEISQVLGITHDITERKQVEEAYRVLVENSRQGLAIVQGQQLRFANPALAEMFGRSQDDLMATPLLELNWQTLHPEDRERIFEIYRQRQENGDGPLHYEARIVRPDDTVRWLENYVSTIHYQGEEALQIISLDITERRQAEAQVRQLSRAIEQSPVSIVITDRQGAIEYVNPKFSQITGYSLAEVEGNTPRVLKSGHTATEDYDELWATITAGEEWRGEFLNKKKNGGFFWEQASISPIFDNEGTITHFLAVKEDITEQKEAEERLQAHNKALAKAKSRLAQSEKLAAIGELIAGVAHELNNPLSSVILYSQLLQRRGVDESSRRDLELIVEQAQRAGNIVQSLLDFARRHPPQRKATQMNDLVASSLNLLDYKLRTHNVGYATDLDPTLPLIEVDPYQMQQVLVNLLNNAYQALEGEGEAGTITIRTRVAPSLFHGPAPEGSAQILRITLADNGPGIPPAVLPRIFDPFFTTKKEGEGTGMGLSVCHGIVSEHGGHLWAESEPGQGATFFIELPLRPTIATPEAETATSPPVAGEQAPAGRILVIDDEQSMRLVLQRALHEGGFHVDVTHSAEAGLARLQKQVYDLILCDVRMPGLGGIGFYRRLVDQRPTLARRVIFVTGDVISGNTNQFLTENDLPHLSKPFNLQQLLLEVQEQLNAH